MLKRNGYRIIFSDVDGTILNGDKDVSSRTINITNKLFEKEEITTVLISARMPAAIIPLSKKLCPNAPLIAYNGALILTPEEMHYRALQSFTFSSDVAKFVLSKSEVQGCHIGIFHSDRWLVNQHDSWTDHEIFSTGLTPEIFENRAIASLLNKEIPRLHKIMVMASSEVIDHLENEIRINFSNEVNVYRSAYNYMEITPAASSKKLGVEYLLDYLGIESNDAIAFGDNYNDLEMLKFVGLGIAVENARETVKAAAKMVTGHGKKDGVADALEQIFGV